MHKWSKEILECVKAKVEAIGIDNFEGQNLDDLKDWTEIAKNIVCFDKDYRIVEAMDKAEDDDEIMDMFDRYGDDRRYYDHYRYKNGRFAPKGRGTRRGYEEYPYYHMMPGEYDPEHWRDLDRSSGRLYYPETTEKSESRYDKAKRMYTETKENHKSGSAEDKQITMREAEKMLNVIFDEIDEMLRDAAPEMRNMVKTKGLTRLQKIS